MGNCCSGTKANRATAGDATASKASGVVTQNDVQQLDDLNPRKSLKDRVFMCWKFVSWSGVTKLVNHSENDIVFYLIVGITNRNERVLSVSARDYELIGMRKFYAYCQSNLPTTVMLEVPDLDRCMGMTFTPEDFITYKKLEFRINNENKLGFSGKKR